MKNRNEWDFASHLEYMIRTNQLKTTVYQSVKFLRTHKLDQQFDSIAFRGISGALIAPVLAMRLNKNLIAVRKSTSGCHSCHTVEGYHGSKRYIIVDDFISSGETVESIISNIREFANEDSQCVGVLCVNKLRDHSATHKNENALNKDSSDFKRIFRSVVNGKVQDY